jgi:nicotinamide-nucleotide amidase
MEIAVLTIGDELLNGDLADTNTPAICRALANHALILSESATVGDSEANIVRALRRLALDCDAVIVTGGLGPTEDDLTAKAAAKAFSRSLSLNDQALSQIRARFISMRREMHPANEKQAMLPSRCSIIPNHNGTAPGFKLDHEEADLFFLPGVPQEMLAMLNDFVIPALLGNVLELPQMCRRNITVFGLPEPEVESRLGHSLLPDGVDVAFNVDFPVVVVKLRASGELAPKQIDRAELAVRKALGDHVAGIGDESLAGNTAQYLSSAGLTLALAESCTGGLIAKLLTDQAGASTFLERSVVSYANSAKMDCLNVPGTILEKHGAVSVECAEAMARGAKVTAQTDIGLSVTGIAGPDGGTEEKPVGTVFMAMTGPDTDRVERFQFHGTRDQVRTRTAFTALNWLRLYAINRLSSGLEG